MRPVAAIKKFWGSFFSASAPAAFGGKEYRQPPKRTGRALLALYNSNPELRRVAHRVATSFGQLGWQVKRKGEVLYEHPVLDLLNRPNPHMSGASCRYLEQVWLDLLEESFAVLIPWGLGWEYYPVPPTNVWFEPEVNSERPWRVKMKGQDFVFPDEQIVQLRHPNVTDPYGRGNGHGPALEDEISNAEYAAKHSKAFFFNNARPESVFVMESAKNKAEVDRAQESYNAKFKGFRNAWSAAFLGGKWNIHQLSSEFGKIGMIEHRQHSADVIRETYGVPPEIIGQLDQSNKATITASEHIFGKYCLLPRCTFYKQEWVAKVLPKIGHADVTLMHDNPVPSDKEFELKVAEAFPYLFTGNEIRALKGDAPREGLDVYLRRPDEWEEVEAGDIIDVIAQPKKKKGRKKALPPAIPLHILQFDKEAV